MGMYRRTYRGEGEEKRADLEELSRGEREPVGFCRGILEGDLNRVVVHLRRHAVDSR